MSVEEPGFSLIEFYEQMTAQESDAFTFVVQRKPEPGRSLSTDAMDQMKNVFGAFLAARLTANLRKRGPDDPGHQQVEVELRVTIDGQSVSVDDERHPWYALADGEHRGKVLH